MADDDQALPWDEGTDSFVKDIDSDVNEKYRISLRELLLDPAKFAEAEDMPSTIGKIREDVTEYFDEIFADMKDDDDELTRQMEAIDAVHTQINQTVSSRAGIGRIPFLKPADFDFGGATPETVFVDKYDGQVDLLITKLINSSNYVCDLSTSYRKYSIGNWLFSGSRSMLLSVKTPESRIIAIENSRDAILARLDNASALFLTT